MALIDNLVSYYPCYEDAANTDVEDVHAANEGTATDNTADLHTVSGIINGAFDLNGTDEYFNIGTGLNSTFNGTNQWTIQAWVNPTVLDNDHTIFSTAEVSTQGIVLSIDSSDRLELTFHDGVTNPQPVSSGTLSTGSQQHVVVTRDGTNVNFYINGSSSGSTAVSASVISSSDDALWGTWFKTGRRWDGIIGECGIWSRALSSGEVSELYNSGNALAYPFTVGWAGKIQGITPGKVQGISVADIGKIQGVA